MKAFLYRLYYSIFIQWYTTILYNYNEAVFINNIDEFLDGILNKQLTIKPFKK